MMRYLISPILGLLAGYTSAVQAGVNVFACEPEWAALAEEIGGDKVKVFSATHAKQDPHHIRARPSLIAKARRADLLIYSGGGLEVGWLPVLLQKSKAEVQPGQPGHLMASEFVDVIEKPVIIDRSQGDVHPEGNPHIHLNPHNMLPVASVLAERLAVIDKGNADFYRKRLDAFSTRWKTAIARWEKDASGLKGKRVVVQHKSFSYLVAWLQLERAASLEPKPGIPPTVSHLEGLLKALRKDPAVMIIRTPYESANAGDWLSDKTDIPVLVLPYTVGGDSHSGDLFKLFDRSLALLKGDQHDQ